MSKPIAERRGVTQSISVNSGASQIDLDIVAGRVMAFVTLSESEAIDLRDELDNHIAKLASARNSRYIANINGVDNHRCRVRPAARTMIEPEVLAVIPELDAALGECE